MILLNNLPLLMVVVFLCLTIVLAFYYMERITTFREYAVGCKQLTTATLVATLLATYFGGGTVVHNVEQAYSEGVFGMTNALLLCFLKLWLGSRLILRMAPFMKNLTIAETIGSVYGKYPRIITALCSIGLCIAYIAIQINVMSLAIRLCVGGFNPRIITTFVALILIIYTSTGGVRVITFTDIVQLGVFFVIFPVLSWWLFLKISKPVSEIFSFVQAQERFRLSNMFHFDIKVLAKIAKFLSVLMLLRPAVSQRIYMSSNHYQASSVFLNASIIALIMKGLVLLIGFFIFVAEPVLPVTEVWPHIVANIPTFFKGLVAIGLLALAISTADSELNTCTVMVCHDIVESIRCVETLFVSYKLFLARLVVPIVGLTAMIVAFYCDNLLQLTNFMLDMSVPIITAPLLLAILGCCNSSHAALIGMTAGALAILAWNKWIEPVTEINGAFICMVVNGLAMMATHYIMIISGKQKNYNVSR